MNQIKKLSAQRLTQIKSMYLITDNIGGQNVADLFSHISALETEINTWKEMISTNVMHVQMNELREKLEIATTQLKSKCWCDNRGFNFTECTNCVVLKTLKKENE